MTKFDWASTYGETVKNFHQLSGVISESEIAQVCRLAGKMIEYEVPGRSTSDEEILIIYKTGCILFSAKNRSIYLKEGVSDWSIGRINLRRDQNSMKTLGDDFCKLYEDIKSKIKGTKGKYSVGVTNSGNGLWQHTQRFGPSYEERA